VITENDLIGKNIGLIIKLARSFNPANSTQLDDYIQLGRIGFLKAIRKHDSTRGQLSTLAWHYIRWEIIRYINKEQINPLPLLEEPRLVDHYECIGDKDKFKVLTELLPNTLTNNERSIIQLRAEGFTFAAIGTLHNQTRYWANKHYKLAVKKIKVANQ